MDATCFEAAVKIDGNGVFAPVTITDTTEGASAPAGVTISEPVGTGYTLRIYRDTP